MMQSVGVPLTAKRRSEIFRRRKRIGQRQRMGDAGLIGFRRDHNHVVGEFCGDFLQHLEAVGVHAIVIGDQNAHVFAQ